MPVMAPPLPPLYDEDPSDLFNTGRVLCAHGAHGTVIRASVSTRLRATIGARSVAIKIVPIQGDSSYAKLLQEKVNALKYVECPQLARYIGTWRNTQDVWVVSELIEGGSAREILSYATSNEMESCVAYIIQQACIGLKHLHEVQGSPHGNIRASNLLLSASSSQVKVKLTDYGTYDVLNMALRNRQCYSGQKTWPSPSSPSAAGLGEEEDKREDIWAIGVTVIELIDGSKTVANTQRHHRKPRLARSGNWSNSLNSFIQLATSSYHSSMSMSMSSSRAKTGSLSRIDDLLSHRFVANASSDVLKDVIDRALTRPSTPEERSIYDSKDIVESLYTSGNIAMRVPIIEIDDIPFNTFIGKSAIQRHSVHSNHDALVEQSLWIINDSLKEIIDSGQTQEMESVAESSRRVSTWLSIAGRRSFL